MNARARLVVLSGVHDGASAPIDPAVTLVGRGEDCDVVLTDAGIAELHASITLAGGAPLWRLHADGTDVPMPGDTCDDWYVPRRVGPAWVSVVPAGFEWGASLPLAPASDEPAAAGQAKGSAADTVTPLRQRARAAALVLAAALLALVAGAAVLLAQAGPGAVQAAPRSEPGGREAMLDRLARLLVETRFGDVRIDADAQRVALVGFVDTDEQLGRLTLAARRIVGAGLAVQVKAGSELARRAQQFIGDPGIGVAYDGGGRLRLSGRPANAGAPAGLAARLAQLRADLGSTVVVADQLEAAPDPARAKAVEHPMPIRIAEVQVDEPAHFRTFDGARYFEGARLPDGAEVVRIGAHEILFRKGGREISYAVVE